MTASVVDRKGFYGSVVVLCVIVSTTFIPAILIAWLLSISVRTHFGGITVVTPTRWLISTVLPISLAFRGLVKKSLSLSGAVTALFVGFLMTISNYCFCASLMVFFLTSSRWTKFRAERKKSQEEDYKVGGARNWAQVLCNGGFPASLAVLYMLDYGCGEVPIGFHQYSTNISSWLCTAVIGSLSCACGDTWASEIGSVFGNGTSTLITTGKKVPAGTNGGVTVVGTIASGSGGFVIGLTYYLTILLTCTVESAQWPILATGTLCGLFGSVIDSIFGATLQYSGFNELTHKVHNSPGPDVKWISGINVLDNHAVNFITCFITGCIAPLLHKTVESVFLR